METVKCLHCGKEYRTFKSRIARGSGKFCSKKCYMAYHSKGTIIKLCPICGKSFTVTSVMTAHKRGIFCSKSCADKGKARLTGDKNPAWRGKSREKICPACGSSFIAPSAKPKKKYCSLACYRQIAMIKKEQSICAFCKKSFSFTPRQVNGSYGTRGKYCSVACRINDKKSEGNTYKYKTVNGKSKAKHRIAMEESIGRPLFKHERVHHINGRRGDNQISNLELWSRSHPPGQRVADITEWAITFLAEYGIQTSNRR